MTLITGAGYVPPHFNLRVFSKFIVTVAIARTATLQYSRASFWHVAVDA